MMSPAEKAQLLQAVANTLQANKNSGEFYTIRDNSVKVINLILKSIEDDFNKENNK